MDTTVGIWTLKKFSIQMVENCLSFEWSMAWKKTKSSLFRSQVAGLMLKVSCSSHQSHNLLFYSDKFTHLQEVINCLYSMENCAPVKICLPTFQGCHLLMTSWSMTCSQHYFSSNLSFCYSSHGLNTKPFSWRTPNSLLTKWFQNLQVHFSDRHC